MWAPASCGHVSMPSPSQCSSLRSTGPTTTESNVLTAKTRRANCSLSCAHPNAKQVTRFSSWATSTREWRRRLNDQAPSPLTAHRTLVASSWTRSCKSVGYKPHRPSSSPRAKRLEIQGTQRTVSRRTTSRQNINATSQINHRL